MMLILTRCALLVLTLNVCGKLLRIAKLAILCT